MRRRRLLIPGQRKPVGAEDWEGRPARYHCISRICQRQFLLGMAEKEKFRTLMRMYAGFQAAGYWPTA
ncbi:MAG: hypothetical protein NTW21_07010 [Verrucomicrobia bacterium]|nr:hypothetical protein [Verrucomicrobiota bacterium]